MQSIIYNGTKLNVVSAGPGEVDFRRRDLREKYGKEIRFVGAGDYTVCTRTGNAPSGEFPVNGEMDVVLSEEGKPLVAFRTYPSLERWTFDLMGDDTPESMVEEAGGNPVAAAYEFCEWWFGLKKGEPAYDYYREMRRQLKEDYGMTAWEYRQWLADMLRDEAGVTEIHSVKRIASNGGGYCITITKEVESLGLQRGDEIEIIVRRMPHE